MKFTLLDKGINRSKWFILLCLLFLIAVIFLVGRTLLSQKMLSGHDSFLYWSRTYEFYQNLEAGILLPRWAPDLSLGYGQPFFIFSPPFLYYITSLFYKLGFDLILSENLSILSILILIGLGMYFFASDIFGLKGGFVVSIAYISAPYLLVNLFVRHSLTDFLAFVWLPLAFWGIYRFSVFEDRKFFLLGSVAITFLVLSSNHISLITLPILILFVGWISISKGDWSIFWRGCFCILLGLGLSAYYWLPALVERKYIHLERILSTNLDYHDHFVYLRQFFLSTWGYRGSVAGPDDGMSFSLGLLYLIMVVCSALLYSRIRKLSSEVASLIVFILFLVFGACFLASTYSVYIWERFSILHSLQFPWRFLSISAFATSMLMGVPIFYLESTGRRFWADILMLALIVIILITTVSKARPKEYRNLSTEIINNLVISKSLRVGHHDEYEPIWVKERPKIPSKDIIDPISGEAIILIDNVSPTKVQARINAFTDSKYQVNTFYFPGWVVTDGGELIPIEYDNSQGLIQFILSPGEYELVIQFTDTPVRMWSKILSGFSLVLVLLMILKGKTTVIQLIQATMRKVSSGKFVSY